MSPGFGSGSFGSGPFGQWDWSYNVLYLTIPEIYRIEDEASDDGLLAPFMASLRESFDSARRRIRDWGKLRDPLLVRTDFNETASLRLGMQYVEKGELEQRGTDGWVLNPGGPHQFKSQTARFSSKDVGKVLTISGSTLPENNTSFSVATVIDTYSITTIPEIAVDAGPVRWELRTKVDQPADRITVQVRVGDIWKVVPGWILNDGFADFEVLGRYLFDPVTNLNLAPVIDFGDDLTIDSISTTGTLVSSPTVDFLSSCPGKILTIWGAIDDVNNNYFLIKRKVSSTQVELDAVLSLPETNNGKLNWNVRGTTDFARLVLAGTGLPKGLIEQEGIDLSLISSAGTETIVESQLGNFTALDVGKEFSIFGSSIALDNVKTFVTDYISQKRLKISAVLTTPQSNLRWELRSVLGSGLAGASISAHASSLLSLLAQDFGINVDNQESEERQRTFVRNISKWIGLKGTQRSYEILGLISGFEVDVDGLYRVHPDVLSGTAYPSIFEFFEIVDESVGHFGTNGQLVSGTSRIVRLYSSTATFRPSHVGSLLRIKNASNSSNNGLWVIEVYIDEHTIELRDADYDWGGLPDYGLLGTGTSPKIHWWLSRFYTTLVPTRPLFDEIIADTMEEFSGVDHFGLDWFCWETGFVASGSANLLSATVVSAGRYYVTLSGATSPYILDTIPYRIPTTGTGSSFSYALGVVTFTAVPGSFASTDVGRVLRIASATSSGNNGTFIISAYVSSAVIQYANATGVSEAFGGTWMVVDVSVGVGKWKITETSGNYYYIEDQPILVGAGQYGFEVATNIEPVIGTVTVQYICPVSSDCTYCKSSNIRAVITEGDITAETGVAVERALDRVLDRIKDEVVPAHARLYPVFSRGFEIFISYGGHDGSLISGSTRFTAPSAQFSSAHVGRKLLVSGAADVVSDGVYETTAYVDGLTMEVEKGFEDDGDLVGTLPDENNGSLDWQEPPGFYRTEVNMTWAPFYCPLTAYFDEVEGDMYPCDTTIYVTVEQTI